MFSYEDEINKLRLELSTNSSPVQQDPPIFKFPEYSFSTLETQFSTPPFPKKAKIDTTHEHTRSSKDYNKLEPLEHSTAPISPVVKKEGFDWLVVYNPKVPRELSIELLHSFDHGSVVCCVKFSRDGSLIATGSNKVIYVFDVNTGKQKCVLNIPSDDSRVDLYVRALSFSVDGTKLVSGAEDQLLRVWDIETGVVDTVLKGHGQDIYSVDCSSDGKFIASGSGDHSVRIWDYLTGDCIHILLPEEEEGKEVGATSVAISPDSKYVLSGSLDHSVRLWDLHSGTLLHTLNSHTNSVYSVAFSPDGSFFCSGSLDKTIKVWKMGETVSLEKTTAGHKDFVLSVAYSNDGKWLVSGSKDRSVQFWDRGCSTQLMLQGHKNSVISIAMSQNGNFFATGSGDCRARIWQYRPFK